MRVMSSDYAKRHMRIINTYAIDSVRDRCCPRPNWWRINKKGQEAHKKDRKNVTTKKMTGKKVKGDNKIQHIYEQRAINSARTT